MTTLPEPFKRVKRKIKSSQNPLFEKWLKEWKEEAAKNGSEMQYCFNKALKSLKKFPVKLHSGKECIILENFGAKICQMLDAELEKYKALHPEDITVSSKTDSNLSEDILKINVKSTSNHKKRKSSENAPVKNGKDEVCTDLINGKNKKFSYVPGYRSGPYAILITLLQKSREDDYKGAIFSCRFLQKEKNEDELTKLTMCPLNCFMTKTEIQTEAQSLCDTSFTKPLPGSYYTAWSSMGVLLKKKLVNKQGNPAKFSLSEDGIELACKLKEMVFPDDKTAAVANQSPLKVSPPKKIPKIKQLELVNREGKPKKSPRKKLENVLSQQTQDEKGECVSEPDETIFLLPGSFEIKLLVDTQERDDKHQQSDNMTMRQLKSRNVNFEIRHLKVGDFVWIAKDLHTGYELVLPYIVERKRMDDLGSSIKDGRFHEQKFRLKQSGLENLIYLVEKYGNENQRLGLPLPSLLQAVANTQVLGGFNVKITNNHNDSMRYLDCMTSQLQNIFKDKTLMSCKKSNLPQANLSDDLVSLMAFNEFNKGSEKNRKPTVRQMLVKHLIQLSGVSAEKAAAIVQLYPTPKALMEGLQQPSGEKSIAELTYGGLNRSIGPVIARQIHSLYTSMNLM